MPLFRAGGPLSHAILRAQSAVRCFTVISSLWKHPVLSDHGLGVLMTTQGSKRKRMTANIETAVEN